ncbi:glycerate dehydrogenase [Enterococcus sp. PF1-24]|uniref:D-2-hydroxyacid dehydrogenase n=1 Tax=unclassified Enterococcus TaxID=2608891 RepID=UPI002473CB48|nr:MULTISPECIES: D-2-hydroxyacid dehydrogenase [unclassified Enterococcus]MDH6364572.1 glycerate dehydrogenase [Enterococcus sp. PFB1-1]MDH6401673.1 glycerate dehydrogenase [Enterococcus sp. PF1-24]
MKIVVLDGYVLNPGDLSWEGFSDLAELTVYDRTSYTDKDEIISRIGDAEIILTNKTPIDAEVVAACPNLQYVGVLATGYNVVDLAACSERKIVVTNVPAYSTESVAQATFALLLEICSQVGLHQQAVQAGEWQNCIDFSFTKHPLMELNGKVFGMVGFGQIAQATAKIAHAFGMKVIFYNHQPKTFSEEWLTQVSLAELYQQADIISLHVPQTPETTQMINQTALQAMKKSAILLNTARGGLVEEAALAEALNSGKLRAAGLDVVSVEPIAADNPLLTAKNCYITPHIAWAPTEARQRLMAIAVSNVQAFIDSQTQNQVN